MPIESLGRAGLEGDIVYVVDDDDVSRESIGTLLSAVGVRYESFSGAQEFLDEKPERVMGCLITDVRMPGTSGIELLRRLNEVDPDLPVIVVSGFVDVADTVKAMKLGAITVLTKPFEVGQLREAIDISLRLVVERRAKTRRKRELAALFGQLTDAEWGVLHCLDEGLPNKTTAFQLGISVRTVEDRRRRLHAKLSAENATDLIHLLNEARSLGVDLPPPLPCDGA